MYFHAYTNTHIFLCVFGDVIQARVDRAAPDSYVRVKVSYIYTHFFVISETFLYKLIHIVTAVIYHVFSRGI